MGLEMRQNLDMRLEQKLKLTPQMIQSIEILLLPQMALEERIMAEIESNPVLEIEDGPAEGDVSDPATPSDGTEAMDGGPTDRFESQAVRDDPDDYSEILKRRREARNRDEDAPDEWRTQPEHQKPDHANDSLNNACCK